MWMGTCVGKRNYSYFMWLVITCVTSAFLTVAASITHLVQNSNEGTTFTVSGVIALLLILFAVVVIFLPGTLLAFHTRLVYYNISTNEVMKGTLVEPSVTRYNFVTRFVRLLTTNLKNQKS